MDKEGAPEVAFDNFVLHRHYPGRGSRAMGFLTCASLSGKVAASWVGRAGVCAIRGYASQFSRDMNVVGWHGGHGEALWDSLADLRAISVKARGSGPSFLVGDSNIDHSNLSSVPEPPLPFSLGPRAEGDELAQAALLQSRKPTGCRFGFLTGCSRHPGGRGACIVHFSRPPAYRRARQCLLADPRCSTWSVRGIPVH